VLAASRQQCRSVDCQVISSRVAVARSAAVGAVPTPSMTNDERDVNGAGGGARRGQQQPVHRDRADFIGGGTGCRDAGDGSRIACTEAAASAVERKGRNPLSASLALPDTLNPRNAQEELG
jgi:hypothetical protein